MRFPFSTHFMGVFSANPRCMSMTSFADLDNDGDQDFTSGQRDVDCSGSSNPERPDVVVGVLRPRPLGEAQVGTGYRSWASGGVGRLRRRRLDRSWWSATPGSRTRAPACAPPPPGPASAPAPRQRRGDHRRRRHRRRQVRRAVRRQQHPPAVVDARAPTPPRCGPAAPPSPTTSSRAASSAISTATAATTSWWATAGGTGPPARAPPPVDADGHPRGAGVRAGRLGQRHRPDHVHGRHRRRRRPGHRAAAALGIEGGLVRERRRQGHHVDLAR